ncbi:MAG TPA: hypothetical protein VK504_18015, partial [Vicinamibacterales bacterium]|nr:hypothetical protein [Vicinamibacterales bacterium]
ARKARIRYGALVECANEAFRRAADAQETVHLPRIGTGHGGGEWAVIRDIVQDAAVTTQVNATVYQPPSHGTTPEQGDLRFGRTPKTQGTDRD